MLVEAGAISLVSAGLGAAFAQIAVPAIVVLLAPGDAPAYLDVGFDGRALAFAALIGAFATMAFGLIPALRASSTSPIDAIKASSGGRHTVRARLLRPLVATQLAFSLTVLFLAGLLIASFTRLARVDAGFVPEGVTLVGVELANPAEPHAARSAILTLASQARELRDVASAGFSRWPLMSGAGWSGSVKVNGRRPNDTEVYFLEVLPGFVETMRMRLLAGRDFTRADLDVGSPSVLVNETFARLFLAGSPPLGRRFIRPERTSEGSPEVEVPHEVVGLVGDAKYNDMREQAPPMIYMPPRVPRWEGAAQMTTAGGTLEIRSTLSTATLADAVRRAAMGVTPRMKVTNVTLQSTLVANSMLRERLLALLSGFFALVSLAMAAVGLYGVLSYSVVQQTRAIGIRVALGATRRIVVRGVLGALAGYVVVGTATGVVAGLWLSQFVVKLLYEIRPGTIATIAWPVATLLFVATAAALLPARRAASVDPVVALRDE